jgi:F-type H+-transporting ATPase subunit delta
MSRAAIRYAKAILDIAQSSANAQAVNNDMKLIADTVSGNAELKQFLSSPVIKLESKKEALAKIFTNLQPETTKLFQLLNENKRFEIVEHIAKQYNLLFDEANGIEVAKVTTAVAITPELENKVLEKISTFSNKKVTIENIIDPSIIGGFILRIGDKQFNASVASKLNELKREFSN